MKCCLPFCELSRRKSPNTNPSQTTAISYHEIPSAEELRAKWIAVMYAEVSKHDTSKTKTWIPKITSKVCSNHFQPEDYLEDSRFKKLKRGAVPSRFPPCSNAVITNSRTLKPFSKQRHHNFNISSISLDNVREIQLIKTDEWQTINVELVNPVEVDGADSTKAKISEIYQEYEASSEIVTDTEPNHTIVTRDVGIFVDIPCHKRHSNFIKSNKRLRRKIKSLQEELARMRAKLERTEKKLRETVKIDKNLS